MEKNMEYYLKLLSRINAIYEDMINKKYESYGKLADIHKEIEFLKDEINSEDETINSIIRIVIEEIKLINFLNEKLNKDIDVIRNGFLDIEKKHFEVTNKFITGVVKIEDVKGFESDIHRFKTILYNYQNKDEELLEIAKMKSKIQHFTTEILEDEEVLKMAYQNDNL